ncbi:ALG1 [Symbiodinium necroappetens]|uniref:ALG1 protein n=1 Tax=Symbiodinium necroappetens TaxID=1628268 RepID=A0A812JHA5_9DINO|nr:ALG1 [Symbiodinium necroappetens]
MLQMMASAALVLGVLLLGVLLVLLCSRFFLASMDNPHVIVLVLGDIGRSPRMQYHSLSLARHGCDVTIIGYPGAEPMAELTNSRIRIRHVMPLEISWLPFTLRAGVKVLSLLLRLLALLLLSTPRANVVLVQNPPAIPSLLLARVASTLQGASFIIDFHNFGYSLLALKLGAQHPLVKAHRIYEQLCGQLADDAFCVTAQMQRFLKEQWNAGGPASLEFGGSTSWTPDEDFGQLLDALPAFNENLVQANARAVVIVTGKGDLRQQFEERLCGMVPQLQAVRVVTMWLSFADYALLLGSADLGLSLHSSSSGIDLPMKVVDMFGAGLPVCARSFAALPELVQHGENGLVFSSTEELAVSLAHGLGVNAAASTDLPSLKSPAGKSKLNAWDDHWDAIAWPVFHAYALHAEQRQRAG